MKKANYRLSSVLVADVCETLMMMMMMTCRDAEAEKDQLSRELEHAWKELSVVVRRVYHLDNNNCDTATFDHDRMSGLVSRQVSLSL